MTCHANREDQYWTPQRVRLFHLAVQGSDFPARTVKALAPALAGCQTVLDVGAGVGALAVPLAKRGYQVTALEPNAVMGATLRENLGRNRIQTVTYLPSAWGKDVTAPHDLILVANVAPIFDGLLPFLAEAEPLARQAMALVQNVGAGGEKFYFGELYPHLLGRPYPGREDYLRTVTVLHSLGIYASVQIISYRFDQPFDDFGQAVQFWTEVMRLETLDQERRLAAFLEGRLERVGSRWIAPMRRKSAVVWWRVSPKDTD